MIKMAVLASGTGRTLLNFFDLYKSGRLQADPCVVIVDRQCGALDHAANYVNKIDVYRLKGSEDIFTVCRKHNIKLVALAGFLSKLEIPEDYVNRVMNIHPSLLPSFGGKGMYGHHVHQAVLDYGCKVSGCTVHFVDNEYDHGPIIGQVVIPAYAVDTPDILAKRVFEKECILYPDCVNDFANKRIRVKGRITF